MNATNIQREALNTAASRAGFKTTDRYKKRCEFLFRGIPLNGKNVLDVGCGTGAFAIWAGLHGANRVLGIEPESDGSTSGTYAEFRRSIDILGLNSIISGEKKYLSDLTPSDGPFDVVVMYQMINHLDEEATANLHLGKNEYFDRFVAHISHLRTLVSAGGVVIFVDCDRRNFWNDIGRRNPLMPTIEWEKHQPSGIWSNVFEHAGFQHDKTTWSSMYPLGKMTENWPLHYFTISHFCLRVRAI